MKGSRVLRASSTTRSGQSLQRTSRAGAAGVPAWIASTVPVCCASANLTQLHPIPTIDSYIVLMDRSPILKP